MAEAHKAAGPTAARGAPAPAPAAGGKAAGALAPCEYKTGRTLGTGSYATVKEAVHLPTGTKYAVKVISSAFSSFCFVGGCCSVAGGRHARRRHPSARLGSPTAACIAEPHSQAMIR